MPVFYKQPPQYRPEKDIALRWDNFRGGLNTLLRDNEIEGNELAQAYNLILIGKGIPTKRWGTGSYVDLISSASYYLGAASGPDRPFAVVRPGGELIGVPKGHLGSIRGLLAYYPEGANSQLLTITDLGYMAKKDGLSFASINGCSWTTGYNVEMAQLEDKVYIVSEKDYLKRYSNPALVGFATIAIPTGLFATQVSGASGTAKYSYRVSAISNVGETLACARYELSNQPQDPTEGRVRVTWTAVSTASGILKGYNVWGRDAGDERFLGSVQAENTRFVDKGVAASELTFPPLIDTTGGFRAKYVIRWKDRLVFAGIEGEPDKVIISGRVPFQEKFLLPYGNFIRIEPDSGDDITGLAEHEGRLIVFKERSIWQVTLSQLTVGNYVLFDPVAQLITKSHGCVSHRSIVPVENDLMFLSLRGVFMLGRELQIEADILRTNEVSVKVRSFFDGLTPTERINACAGYYKHQYLIAVPGKDQMMAFDRERLCWMGPWSKDARIFETYFDTNNNEIFVSGEDDAPVIIDWNENYGNDEDTAIDTILKTKREDFGDWTLFKNIKGVFINLKNATGTIGFNLNIENRAGDVVSAKSFTITADPLEGTSGWGADMFGNTLFGDSEATGIAPDTDDFVKWVRFNKMGRNFQVEIETTSIEEGQNSYELLGIRANVQPVGRGLKGDNWAI